MFFILIGIYFGIVTYIETRQRGIFIILGVFMLSFGLEMDRLNSGGYELAVNDFLWTSRDIILTGIIIYFFQWMRTNFQYITTTDSIKRIAKKKSVKKSKK